VQITDTHSYVDRVENDINKTIWTMLRMAQIGINITGRDKGVSWAQRTLLLIPGISRAIPDQSNWSTAQPVGCATQCLFESIAILCTRLPGLGGSIL
jgi:hypothetical protein